MNLTNNPSLSDLSRLIAFYPNYHDNYDLIVDHDSEVFIQPSTKGTARGLKKYKFYFSGLTGKEQIGIIAARNLRYINQLYKNLVYCWENNLKGKIDYDEITNMKRLNDWLEINNISTIPGDTVLPSAFYKDSSRGRSLSC